MGRGLATEEQPVDEIRPTQNRAVGTRKYMDLLSERPQRQLHERLAQGIANGQQLQLRPRCGHHKKIISRLTCAIVCMTMAKKHRR
jgi:ribosomal protein S7